MKECKRCEDLEFLIRKIFKATGYMDLYEDNITMMGNVIIQGIKKDKKALDMYREVGEEAIKVLNKGNVLLVPNSTQGHFV